MLMFDGPFEVLFYALPPNSQFYSSEPAFGPFFEDFDGPLKASGLRRTKKLNKTKCS